MYAATSPFSRSTAPAARAYQQVAVATGLEGASAHKLIAMLFDGFQEAVSRARGALATGQLEAKGRAIAHAARIVEEGLRGGLNLREGGALAGDLDALYTYVSLRLTHANLHNDDAALVECAELLKPLAQAWSSIGSQVAPAATAS